MIGDNRLHSKEEIRKEIQELLSADREVKGKDGKKYNGTLSNLGKKHTLTRWIHQSEEYYNNVLTAYSRPHPKDRYYLGDFITSIIVTNAKRDVEVMKEMRKELDQIKEP